MAIQVGSLVFSKDKKGNRVGVITKLIYQSDGKTGCHIEWSDGLSMDYSDHHISFAKREGIWDIVNP